MWLQHLSFLCLGISMIYGRPPQTSLDTMMKNGMISMKSLKTDDDVKIVKSGEYFDLLDAEKWKELLAQGKVRDMIDNIQRALGSNRPVRVRTQWGGESPNDLGNSIRNTINWNAYEGDKSNLNVIMDSKFTKKDGKVDMIHPNIGMHYELRY